MSILGFLGGYDKNPYEQFNEIGNRQYATAEGFRNGSQGSQLYKRNNNTGTSMLAVAYNNMRKDLASKNINSTALNKQNLQETQANVSDRVYNANLDSWQTIQNIGLQYENLGNQSKGKYGEGEQWKGEQQNSFLNSVIGVGGSILGQNLIGGNNNTNTNVEKASSSYNSSIGSTPVNTSFKPNNIQQTAYSPTTNTYSVPINFGNTNDLISMWLEGSITKYPEAVRNLLLSSRRKNIYPTINGVR